MANFCVNTTAQANGDHEVHDLTVGCVYEPAPVNRKSLGNHANCAGAVTEAKRTYPQSNGCRYCAPACHTS